MTLCLLPYYNINNLSLLLICYLKIINIISNVIKIINRSCNCNSNINTNSNINCNCNCNCNSNSNNT